MGHKKLFITTTLPYPTPSVYGIERCGAHVGHLLEFVLTDAIARFNKIELGKENVFFSTGLDEEGLKNLQVANKFKIPIQEFLDKQAELWKGFCTSFQIDYDNFYRTSSKDHQKKVQKLWNVFLSNDDLYKKEYSALYCVNCESFKTEKDLMNGKCPDHQTGEIKTISEENWFFRLSKFKDYLFNWIEKNPDFLSPANKLDELKNIINNIEDISVSRLKTNVPWGTEVPNDPEQIVYIWLSALSNYVFSCGLFEDEDKFNGWWDNTVQVFGPDNLKFQAVIFQAMLSSAKIKQSGKLLVHGTILSSDGSKMSKTTGNVIDPIDQLQKFGLDAVRYYALAGLNTYSNSNWSENELKELYNAHLANNFGNLIARVLHLVDLKIIDVSNGPTSSFQIEVDGQIESVKTLWKSYSIKEALNQTNQIATYGNKYFQDNEPWKESCVNQEVLSNLYYLLNEVTELYYPALPQRYDEIKSCLLEKKKVVLFPRIK